MPTYDYIKLKNSLNVEYKFRVIFPDYSIIFERAQSLDRTLDGTLDAAQGANKERHPYVLRVNFEESETGYGTLENLRDFWKCNNPNGSPSDKFTLTDHFGNTRTVIFKNQFVQKPMTTSISGAYSHWLIPVELIEV